MSLLLDALKKAAEQKAEKSKKEETPTRGSDETLVDAADEISSLEDATDVKLPQEHRLQDETEIEHSELETRLERTLLEREPGDDTGIDAPDATETEMPGASAQMRTGEDETIIFADDDVADFMGEPQFVTREPRAAEDETDLSQLGPREDETDLGRPQAAADAPADETDLSQYAEREDETDLSQLLAQDRAGEPGDETDLSQHAEREDETDLSLLLEQGGVMESAPADETDLSQLPPREQSDSAEAAAPVADETDLGDEDRTDISEPIATVADLDRVAARQSAAEDADSGHADSTAVDAGQDQAEVTRAEEIAASVTDDDMSLLLVERDQTNLTTPTSATDPQVPQGQVEALQEGAEELALVDTTRHQAPSPEQTETVAAPTQTGVTAGTNYDTQGTTRRAETTSTRTYAPDNYDRTLMRLPSDDASKLFAGMKSDNEVVMTPEYAKKVFHSKSSAQRVQHYKFYAGIAVVILLSIGVFGLFEFQEQSNTIDASLQPLKRDPMPGVVRTEQESSSSNLFSQVEPEAEVSERTISIIESAEQIEDADAAGLGAAEGDAADTAAAVSGSEEVGAVEAGTVAATPPAGEPETAGEVQAGVIAAESAPAAAGAEPVVATAPAAETAPSQTPAPAGGSSSTLQISSSSKIQDKDRWLHQAFKAYQAGNDELALELYNKVLAVDPGNRNALLARAAINVQNNEVGAAVEDYQALLLANPKDSLAMTSLISVASYSPRETETQLKLMIREEPDSPYLNFALANAYGAQDRWMEAQGHYFTALQNNPDDPNYAYNLAVSLEHIAQPRAAMTYYQRALDNMENGLATFNRNLVDQRLEVLGKL